jgi:hypothetical protein
VVDESNRQGGNDSVISIIVQQSVLLAVSVS